MVSFLIGLANVLMVFTSLFLICLVLIQRGKGGGLAGAFGGVGGSSAFGTKAGDVFTRVTIYVACAWFLLAMFLVWSSNSGTTSAFNRGISADSSTADDDLAKPPVTDKAAGDKAKPAVDAPVVPAKPADAAAKPAAATAKPADVPPASTPAKTP